MIIAVYAPHDPRDKRMLWDYLAHVINQWQGEVVIMGDFNEVRVKSDRFPFRFCTPIGFILEGFNDFVTSTWNSDPSDYTNELRNFADKTSGHYGVFAVVFYRIIWPVIEHDVYMAVNHFFKSWRIPPVVTQSFKASDSKSLDANLNIEKKLYGKMLFPIKIEHSCLKNKTDALPNFGSTFLSKRYDMSGYGRVPFVKLLLKTTTISSLGVRLVRDIANKIELVEYGLGKVLDNETVKEVLLPQVHHEFLLWEGCSRDTKSRYNTKLVQLLPRHIYSPCVVNWDVLNQMGCDGEIDDMLRIRLREAGTNEEIFTHVAWKRSFNINEPIYAELCHEFYSTYEFDEVCADDELQTKKIIKFRLGGRAHSLTLLEFARRLGLYQAVELD
ncbi:retrotransposon ORF1, partial [Tanacetum coccineum]